MSIVIAGLIAVSVVLPLVLWLDGVLNENEFLEVKEWENFKAKMGRK